MLSQKAAMIAVRNQLPANSIAALGVVKAVWKDLQKYWKHTGYSEAICRHREVSESDVCPEIVLCKDELVSVI